MIGRPKFQSRRVFLVHGLLLVAVLIVAYLSALAQYEAMRDQQLEEVRSQQQVTLRASGQVIQQGIQKLATDLAATAQALPGAGTRTEDWLTAVFTVDAESGRVVRVEKKGPATLKLPDILPLDQIALETTGPALRALPGPGGLTIMLLTPTAMPGQVRVGIVSAEQLLDELGNSNSQSTDEKRVTALMTVGGNILIGNKGIAGQPIDTALADNNARRVLTQLQTTNAAASAVVQTDDGQAAVLAVQAIDPLADVHWYAVAWRPGEGRRINAALQPLVWQLVGGAALIITAVAIVLASTTMSLYKGRRRIEELRMEMLRRDLEKARRIQLNWLPKPHNRTETLEIAAENKAAAHISGDFYNWFELGPDTNCPNVRTALVIGDVSGHGLSAAFLMATTQMIVRNTLPRLCDPGACLGDLNKQLASLVYNGQFVTIAILLLDLEAGAIEMASAGHQPPLLRRNGRVTEVDLDPDLVCGVDPDVEYKTHRLRVEPGDLLLLYTDGAIETHNAAGEQFGIPGLQAALTAAPDDVDSALSFVTDAVEKHHNDEDAEDDLTVVAVRILPQAALRNGKDNDDSRIVEAVS